ncbi:hypothetical protein ACF0H5_015005 [Mactra antiquata]
MWLPIFSFFIALGVSSSQQINSQAQLIQTTEPPVRYALLLRELTSVTNRRKALESQLAAYKHQHDLLSRELQAQKVGCHCNSSTIAFTAHLNRDVKVFGVDQPYPFEEVTLNEGNGYDARHSQFRAPVAGLYRFVVTLATQSGYRVSADMMLNDKIIVKLQSGTSNYFSSATNGIYLQLNAGDDVWVQHDHSISDSNYLFQQEGLLSTFSGYLISRQ